MKFNVPDYAGPGVYALYNVVEHKIYIGKSKNIRVRLQGHRIRFLKHDDGLPMYKDPLENFVFLVLQELTLSEYEKFGMLLEELFIVQAERDRFDLYNVNPKNPRLNALHDALKAAGTAGKLKGAVKRRCGVDPQHIEHSKEPRRKYILDRANGMPA